MTALSIGDEAQIITVATDAVTAERLRLLNIYPSAVIRLLRRAPFKRGIMVFADGLRVALRKDVADKIEVAVICA